MNRSALYARIQKLLFISPILAEAFTRGDFHSIFKGRGMEFDSLREYNFTDDARLIDWNVSLRFDRPFVRDYLEDHSLNLFVLTDVSSSMDMGSEELSKRDMAVILTSLLSYAGGLRGLALGAFFFAKVPLRYFSPKRGKRHALAIMQDAISYEADSVNKESMFEGSELARSILTVNRVLKKRSLILIISDFCAKDYATPLMVLAQKHDVIVINISDPLDSELPHGGSFMVKDSESSARNFFPLGKFWGERDFRAAWRNWQRSYTEALEQSCVHARVPLLTIATTDDPAQRLIDFFSRRH